MQLVRQLSFIDIYLTSLGYIIGAGIYILIGKTAKFADKQTWMAFLIAGILALLNTISYTELSHLYKKNGGEYDFISSTLGEIPGAFATLILLLMSILTTTTVAMGMGEFFKNNFNMSTTKSAAFLILMFGIINMISVRFTTNINKITATVETLALILIVILGWNKVNIKETIKFPSSLTKVGYATMIAMFAYIGFETTIKLTEEAINPDRDIPLALTAALITSIILYVAVSMVATNVLSRDKITSSATPIAVTAGKLLMPSAFNVYNLITFFAISGTILTSILGSSRMLYGVSEYYSYLSPLRYVNEDTKTPVLSILVVTLLSILALIINSVEQAAVFTSYLFFIILILVNISLIYLHYKDDTKEKLNELWSSSLNKHFPVTPVTSIVTSIIALLSNF
jgi:amino acid transporter